MKNTQEAATKQFEELAAVQSKHIGNLLGNMLKKKYPCVVHELSLDDLLHWNLWPNFMKIFGELIPSIILYTFLGDAH